MEKTKYHTLGTPISAAAGTTFVSNPAVSPIKRFRRKFKMNQEVIIPTLANAVNTYNLNKNIGLKKCHVWFMGT